MKTFGIPQTILPINDHGQLKEDSISEYFEHRLEVERDIRHREEACTTIDFPDCNDILLGRGKPYQDFLGNIRLRKIIDSHWNRYNMAEQTEKSNISMEIVQKVKASGARFLERHDNKDEWIEVEASIARQKVSHGFRNQTKRTDRC